MKLKNKSTLLVLLSLLTVIFITGCGGEVIPYETNDADDYTVSVKFDANGGSFTTNTFTIVDSYNIGSMDANGSGMVEIPLITPDNPVRGSDAFAPVNNGHFLAGWYTDRIESTDENGNPTYTYSGKWDFDKDVLQVDPNKEYTSKEPVITLYAAWVPLFKIEFYSIDSGELLDSYSYDPNQTESILVPQWDESTGAIEMYRFPKKSGYTFANAYYDAEGTSPLNGATVEHTGKINYENGTAENHVMKLYVEWTEGEWYRIYTAEQFADNANLNGCYEICADLDFSDEIWPTLFMYGNFNGKIVGNGHTMKNIQVTQTNNSKVNAGMFGFVTEMANISDITFDNVTFTVKNGTRVVGTSYGIFAGTVSNTATLSNVKLSNSNLLVDNNCYFGSDDYTIGLVCGMGDYNMIQSENLNCYVSGVATDDEPGISVVVDGNEVTVVTNP